MLALKMQKLAKGFNILLYFDEIRKEKKLAWLPVPRLIVFT